MALRCSSPACLGKMQSKKIVDANVTEDSQQFCDVAARRYRGWKNLTPILKATNNRGIGPVAGSI